MTNNLIHEFDEAFARENMRLTSKVDGDKLEFLDVYVFRIFNVFVMIIYDFNILRYSYDFSYVFMFMF